MDNKTPPTKGQNTNETGNPLTEIITREVAAKFRSFGGDKTSSWNPIAAVLKDKQPQFAAGVDIKKVVQFVSERVGEKIYCPDFETATRMVAGHIHGQGKFYIEIAVDPKTKEVAWSFNLTIPDEVVTVLQLASKLNTGQGCPDENHAVVVAAMDALKVVSVSVAAAVQEEGE